MKTLDHAFNVDGLRKSGRKWRAMLKSVPMLGRVCTKTAWSVPCGVPQTTMKNVERSIVHGAQPHTVQEIKKGQQKRKTCYDIFRNVWTNRRRTLTERVLNNNKLAATTTTVTVFFRDPRHAHVGP